MPNHVKRGIRYEKEKARAHRGRHIGGPGNPDYVRGSAMGEIKNRITKVTKPELQKMKRNGITEVESKAGFTQPAVDYRDRYCPGLKLFRRSKRL